MKTEHIEWCKRHHASIRDGGSWGVPRSGLVFKKTVTGFELVDVMPYTDDLAFGASIDKDVPQSAEALLEWQREDFACIQRHNKAAGLEITDPKALLTQTSERKDERH